MNQILLYSIKLIIPAVSCLCMHNSTLLRNLNGVPAVSAVGLLVPVHLHSTCHLDMIYAGMVYCPHVRPREMQTSGYTLIHVYAHVPMWLCNAL